MYVCVCVCVCLCTHVFKVKAVIKGCGFDLRNGKECNPYGIDKGEQMKLPFIWSFYGTMMITWPDFWGE